MWVCGETICLASQYDVKTIIPLLVTCFDQLNPTSQGCGTIIDLPTPHFEQKNVICLVLKHPWSKSPLMLLLLLSFYLFRRLSILPFTCADPLSWWWSHKLISKC
jgi:hypothetical protein